MDLPLERQRPILGWPALHIEQARRDLMRVEILILLEHQLRTGVDPPRKSVRPPLVVMPDRSMLFEEAGGDGGGSGEDAQVAHVVQDTVAHRHPFRLLAVTRLEAEEREATLARDLEVLGGHDDHPMAARHRRRCLLRSAPGRPEGATPASGSVAPP